MNIFDFAMKVELQGKTCYLDVAARTSVPGFKTIFTALAADEQKHYEIFRDLKAGKTSTMTESRVLEHAKSVFGELVSNKEAVMEQLREDIDAYKVGLKIEEDSIKLYEDMAHKEQDPDAAQLYLTLANEEKKHFNIIDNICDFIMRPKYYLAWRECSNLYEL